jgi:SAM-dependent methyltransferase
VGVSEPTIAPAPPRSVIWHDLECGGYRADLALWQRLASQAGSDGRARILDVGAGTGRVALPLARAGHRVTALERDPELLQALTQRKAGLANLEPVLADARGFVLEDAPFDLCLVPMQTLQLFGGPRERARFMRSAQAHLRPGGLLACAIVTELDEFDRDAGDPVPSPETVLIDGVRHASAPVRVAVDERSIMIERERSIPALGLCERDAVTLASVDTVQLGREAERAGLRPRRTLDVPATAEHVGSEVMVARA